MRMFARVLAGVLLVGLSGCMFGPDYKRPDTPTPSAYKEMAGLKLAEPRHAGSDQAWWAIYDDPTLDGLMRQVAVSNQSLKANEAAVRQARALVRETRATLFPAVILDAGVQGVPGSSGGGGRARLSDLRAQYDLSLGATWELDLWGRVRRTVESQTASAQASEADLAAARLSLQTQLATSYVSLRARDQQKRILDEAAQAYGESLRITRNQYNAGIVARGDMVQAETQLLQTEAQAVAVGIQRAQFEHAIAVLIGKPPAELAVAAEPMPEGSPIVPPGLPSSLLERRPDVAAAERRMAAASAAIGAEEAAYFPDISLSAGFGAASATFGGLFSAGNRGAEMAASLTELLFDWGGRKARIRGAEAVYDQTVALYRDTTLTAFQQVEDQLSALRILADQAAIQDRALAAARESERLQLNQYRAGTVDYISVVTAQQIALNNAQTALSIQESRLLASVNLVTSLGGGWSDREIGSVARQD